MCAACLPALEARDFSKNMLCCLPARLLVLWPGTCVDFKKSCVACFPPQVKYYSKILQARNCTKLNIYKSTSSGKRAIKNVLTPEKKKKTFQLQGQGLLKSKELLFLFIYNLAIIQNNFAQFILLRPRLLIDSKPIKPISPTIGLSYFLKKS